MTQDQIMRLVDEYATLTADIPATTKARAAVVAALEALTKDAARWKMLAEMEASMTAGETLRFYIAYPDKLDYVIELKHNAYDSAIAAQKEQIK